MNPPALKLVTVSAQGASISPLMVYIDDLFLKLQDSGLGCYINNQFMGAAGYADDIVILSPSRAGLQSMVEICENYCNAHGIKISCDENPRKSKTKCIIFNKHIDNPANIVLKDIRIPWTDTYKHLGHHIHKDENMHHDLNAKRGEFISSIHSLRQEFGMLNPHVFMRLISIYYTSFYGSNLWDLGSESSERLWSSWNILLKSTFSLPFATHRYISNGLYGLPHLKSRLIKRFINFHISIRNSNQNTLKVLYNTQRFDTRSIFGRNCQFVQSLCGTHELSKSGANKFQVHPIPAGEKWRLPMLSELLNIRDGNLSVNNLNCDDIQSLIDYLCCEELSPHLYLVIFVL